ncbi:hypothetical protein O59_003832 [Cellvibrio sp. BR]|uniref:outer membrane protein assembly factor BamE domain-containing protein n=1 Tax=unclassified Cellvibrio TaxID=2624793 RepID=UPI00026018DC|nr:MULTISPECIES: outer membrane protein assembly factor BamE [unclassified Cellvibrio]EIK43434.1 hypothetical protein O59_003832 [Cellvibrio sp. BR]QEY12000.1 outer membrane protein assembly factor BamE [Cellvibrio sp. KY-YJ-3]
MKKSLVVMGLIGLLTAQAQAADLFGSLKKASESVDQAQAKVAETQAKVEDTSTAASNVSTTPEQSAVALVKSKLGNDATKAKVQATLGAPVTTSGEADAEVWFYNVSSVNATAAQAAQVAAALGVNAAANSNKQVAVHFAGDKVSNVAIAEAVAAE